MTTPFALLLARCGLSQREAAGYLNLSPSNIDKMARGARATPAGVIAELQALYRKISVAAENAVAAIMETTPAGAQVELGYAADDYEAQQLGWPCVGAQLASFGITIASIEDRDVRLVPRGSTVGTAAAAHIHGK
jgi:hypothetical protein